MQGVVPGHLDACPGTGTASASAVDALRRAERVSESATSVGDAAHDVTRRDRPVEPNRTTRRGTGDLHVRPLSAARPGDCTRRETGASGAVPNLDTRSASARTGRRLPTVTGVGGAVTYTLFAEIRVVARSPQFSDTELPPFLPPIFNGWRLARRRAGTPSLRFCRTVDVFQLRSFVIRLWCGPVWSVFLSVPHALRIGIYEGLGTPRPCCAVGLLLAAAARGIGVDGAL